MLVAIASNDGSITRCFEEVRRFELHDVRDDGQTPLSDLYVKSCNVIEVLVSAGVDLLICGNIDHNGEAAVRKSGIRIIRDTIGLSCDVLSAWRAGYLEPSDSPMCTNARF